MSMPGHGRKNLNTWCLTIVLYDKKGETFPSSLSNKQKENPVYIAANFFRWVLGHLMTLFILNLVEGKTLARKPHLFEQMVLWFTHKSFL